MKWLLAWSLFLGGAVAAGAQTSLERAQQQRQVDWDKQQFAAFEKLESDNERYRKPDVPLRKPNQPPTPFFAVAARTPKHSPTVCLQIREPDLLATVYYTEDGATPSASATLYTGPICVKRGTKVRAIALYDAAALPPSEIASYRFR